MTLTGKITGSVRLSGQIGGKGKLAGSISGIGQLSGGIVGAIRGNPAYEGSYEATSLPFSDQTLETEGKRMAQNVTVKQIPYAETPNLYGTTISISS